MKELERIRWRCRRGLLELDIMLERFIEKYYARLDNAHLAAFDMLLDLPDNELWDMIAERLPGPQQGEQRIVLQWLRSV
ncbi:MAG: succinate dehydrogenase assembly factor 2 [Pseudomonadota bacterium]